VWQQGNVYDGEWRCGKMHGQGTLRWNTGERLQSTLSWCGCYQDLPVPRCYLAWMPPGCTD